jgi:proteasome lid subunit RPN8/RPN11
LRELRRLNLEILAVYHSHPQSEPIPSKTDLELSYGERLQNLILGRIGNEWVLRSWWLTWVSYDPGEWRAID